MKCCVCFCSPNSSTVVMASFGKPSCDFPLSYFGHPPNMVTCVRPGPKLEVSVYTYKILISAAFVGHIEDLWLLLLFYNINIKFFELVCTAHSVSWTSLIIIHMHITTHLPPPPRVNIQDPCILQSVVIVIPSPSDQQLGVLLPIVKVRGSMDWSPHWPRDSLRSRELGPFLGQVTQHTYTWQVLYIMELVTSYSVFTRQ